MVSFGPEDALQQEGVGVAGSRATIVVASFALRRDALAALLENAGFEVAARPRNLQAALNEVETGALKPALLLADLRIWTSQDVEALSRIRALSSQTKVVVLADRLRPLITQQLLSSGVEGFLTPDIREAALLRYLELVLLGERLYHPDIRTPGPQQEAFAFATEQERGTTRLSSREREVLNLLAGGLSNKHIARKLAISDGTVKVYVRNLCRKLGQRNRTQLATWAVVNDARSGLTDGGESAA